VTIVLLLATLAASAAIAPAARAQVRESKFELFVSDPVRSVAFYALLGFTTAHAKPDGYTTVTSGATVIALSPLPGWLPMHWLGFLRHPPLGTEIVLYVDDLEPLRAALEQAGHVPGEIALQPWGDRDFRVSDPDGYYLRISQGTAVPRTP
jgi:hypothetical protein